MLLDRLNEVHWTWLVYLEMFVAGVAAGAMIVNAILEYSGRGRSPTARTAQLVAFPLMVLAGILLILDLTRPERFWHMVLMSQVFLPMLKPWSPMSAGTQLLTAFSGACFISFVDALISTGRLRFRGWRREHTLHGGPLGVVWATLVAALAICVALYSAVLLNTTNMPGWAHETMIPAVYITTALITGVAAVLLIQALRRQIDDDILGLAHSNLWFIGWWLLTVLVFVLTLIGNPGVRVFLTGVPLIVLLLSVVLAGIVPLLLALFRPTSVAVRLSLSSALVLIGGFLMRAAIVIAPQVH